MRLYRTRVLPTFVATALATLAIFSTRSLVADSFDWRSYGGYNWNSKVKSQFGGTCWDFSACGTIEAKYRLTRNDPTYDADISEQQVCWETSPNMGSTDGGWAWKVLDYAAAHGIVSEAECPKNTSSPDTGVAPDWPLDLGWENRVWKITTNQNRYTRDTDTIKADLKRYGPMVVGLLSTNDLFSSVSSLKSGYKVPKSGIDHEVSLVGYYDDATVPSGGYWVIKNSWGGTGNYYVPYGNIENHNDVDALTGPVYYSGAMVSATWKGGANEWKSGSNFGKTDSAGADYAWENRESKATFSGAGGVVTVTGKVIAHAVAITSGATNYSFNGGDLTITAGGILASADATFTTPISIGGPQTWIVASGKNLTVGSLHTLISPLTIQTNGTATITGSLDGGGVLNSAGAEPGSIIKTGSGTLYFTGAATYAVPIKLSGGIVNFAEPAGVSANLNGVISGSGNVTKSDAGVLRINGDSTFGGYANIVGGTMMVNGSLTRSIVNVRSGGTLAGTGSVNQAAVYADGHLSPGDDGIGTLSILSPMYLYSGAKLDYDLDSPTNSDQLKVSGAFLSLEELQFSDFAFKTSPNFGIGTYRLIDANYVSGNLGANTWGSIGDLSASLSLQNGDVMLTVVPEPSAVVLLLIGAVGLIGYGARHFRRAVD